MDLHERQQFDHLLHTAAERYVDRLEQRNEGAANALRKLRADPDGDGVWLSDFVQAVFQDFLLDNVEGACFLLKAMPRRPVAALPAGDVATAVQALARQAFAGLLRMRAEEMLEQHEGYQG